MTTQSLQGEAALSESLPCKSEVVDEAPEGIATESPAPSKRGGKSGGKRVSMAPRSRELMEKRQYTVANVEHWNAFTKRKHDLYGFIDLLCVRGEDIVGVQVTSWDNVGDRAKKITEHENYDRVKHAIRIVVQGWKKVAGRWIHREVEL